MMFSAMSTSYRHTRPINGMLTVALIAMLAVVCTVHASPRHASPHDDQWYFTVYLDDTEIGYHRFSRSSDDDVTTITSNANFEVRFLFFTAYSYEHSNMEVWSDGCLAQINAVTNDNGDQYVVNGSSTRDSFIINDSEYDDSSCVKTFAYWDRSFLDADALLNSQTGEIIEVTSEYLGDDTLVIDDIRIEAGKYRLSGTDEKGEPIQIDLWYSDDGRWLGLQSYTESGHVIRYRIEQASYR